MISTKTDASGTWPADMRAGVTRSDSLGGCFAGHQKDIESVINRYPMRISPYFYNLIKTAPHALAKQVIPDIRELSEDGMSNDPLSEERQSPVTGLIHRYPDRVLFQVSNQCAVFCRYCMRKRMVGRRAVVNEDTRKAALDYIKNTRSVREVILSGGDPLLLQTDALNDILKTVRGFDHIEIIRIHTRVPGVLPSRITNRLVNMLKKYQPLFINIQFNHPAELTEQVKAVCAKLADAGISLGSQTVLLKGINDDPKVMMALMRKLLTLRIRPYYLHHPDVIKGTGHFRVDITVGLNIIAHLRGRLSGIGIPHYMIDLPGGGGKVALLPESIKRIENGMMEVAGLDGKTYSYPVGEELRGDM